MARACGDPVFVCFWEKLVYVMKLTQPSVSRLEPVLKLCDREVLESVIFRTTAWTDAEARGQVVSAYSC